jgi:uncharacterized protein
MKAETRKPLVLVTGGSEGIGYELARCFARDGYDLVLVARDGDKLDRVADEIAVEFRVRADVIAHDLSIPESAGRLFTEIQRRGLAIDVLVNNAGVGFLGPFGDAPLHHDLLMMRLNVESLVALTKLFLPAMIERRRGAVLNVGSTAGFQPGPLMAVYYATKAFVLSFSEALASELQGTGVRVSVLCPGPTRTAFQRKAGISNTVPLHGGVMTAREVAEQGYAAFKRGRTTIVPGWSNRLLAFCVRLAPRRLVPRVVRNLQKKRMLSRR